MVGAGKGVEEVDVGVPQLVGSWQGGYGALVDREELC